MEDKKVKKTEKQMENEVETKEKVNLPDEQMDKVTGGAKFDFWIRE